jgi:hypothetical protein
MTLTHFGERAAIAINVQNEGKFYLESMLELSLNNIMIKNQTLEELITLEEFSTLTVKVYLKKNKNTFFLQF